MKKTFPIGVTRSLENLALQATGSKVACGKVPTGLRTNWNPLYHCGNRNEATAGTGFSVGSRQSTWEMAGGGKARGWGKPDLPLRPAPGSAARPKILIWNQMGMIFQIWKRSPHLYLSQLLSDMTHDLCWI